MPIRFLLFLPMLSPGIRAAEPKVVGVGPHPDRILVARPTETAWAIGEKLCVTRRGKRLACGKVVRLDPDAALVALYYRDVEAIPTRKHGENGDWMVQVDFKPVKLPLGSGVERAGFGESAAPKGAPDAKAAAAREPASAPSSSLAAATDPEERIEVDRWNAVTAGMHFIFPTVHFRHMVTPHFASGIQGSYLTYPVGSATLSGLGGLLSFSYFRDGPLSGLWVEVAAGAYDLSVSLGAQEESTTTFSATLAAGWRWRWRSGLTYGLGIGAQALLGSRTALLTEPIPALLPLLVMDFGFSF